jgi:XTP/dITP diphosphohydrolase
MRIVLASNNPGKLREFREALSGTGLELVAMAAVGLRELPKETGFSYAENTLLKAAAAALDSGLPALADDSGLEVEALLGAPGLYSARFGGEGLSDAERIAYLLSRLKETPREARAARFVSVIALAMPSGTFEVFEGSCLGTILLGPHGDGGFGYDPVFYSPELGKTFAEADLAEKQQVSHRGRALAQLVAWLRQPTSQHVLRETVAPREPIG